MRVRQDRMKLAGETRRRKRLDGPRARDASDDQLPTVRLPPAQSYLSQYIRSLLTFMFVLRESKFEKTVQCLHLRIQCINRGPNPRESVQSPPAGSPRGCKLLQTRLLCMSYNSYSVGFSPQHHGNVLGLPSTSVQLPARSNHQPYHSTSAIHMRGYYVLCKSPNLVVGYCAQ